MAELRFESVIPSTQKQLFDFHMDFANVRIVTPPFIRTRFVTVPDVMAEGSRITVEVAQLGRWMPWDIRVEKIEADSLLVDVQDGRGPFAAWRHEHRFEARSGRTFLIDTINYTLPFGPRGRIADLFVMQWIQRLVFRYRHRKTAEYFQNR